MKQYQNFLSKFSQLGQVGKNPDGKIGISLPTYLLEYKFEKAKRRRIYGKPSYDGFPLITNVPNVIISDMLEKINHLPLREFEDFNRCINNFIGFRRQIGSLKVGKSIELPFLKDASDFRVPTCKIIEPVAENHNEMSCLNLEITLYHNDVIWKLPKCLDTITIFYCVLCVTTGYSPNKISFNLVRPFCEDKYLKDLDVFLLREPLFKAMRIRPGLTSLMNLKLRDVEFSLWNKREWVNRLILFFLMKKLTE